jgi:prepilin-type N-terminal cleavage/methylation domain-containing protein/prepilin-type processing-associated H-X9-DG protein
MRDERENSSAARRRRIAGQIVSSRGFTLVEMLVTMAIIALLISVLLPSMSRARVTTLRVVCASNIRQCGLALWGYAQENGSNLPPACNSAAYAPAIFRLNSTYDLRSYLRRNIRDFKAWQCPALGQLLPIDDAINTRFASYGTYDYYPGRAYPDFGTGAALPTRLDSAPRQSQLVAMQDVYYDDQAATLRRFNHGNGTMQKPLPSDNPSIAYLTGVVADGANILFYDGHAAWQNAGEMRPAGYVVQGLTLKGYSVVN